MSSISIIDYIVIGVYLVSMVLVGIVFKRFNQNTDDFVRSGCRATWWLVGTSSFMTAFSAWTFTGAAGAAYEAGWSFTVIFATNAIGFLVQALFLAPWFRQLRAVSIPEVVKRRFNVQTQQFVAYLGSFVGIFGAAITLYGLAVFTAAVFGMNIKVVIIALGVVVLFYSCTSGNWAVMATDFIQAIILFPLTLLIAILALIEIGGVGGLMHEIEVQGLTEQYKLFNTGEFNDRVIDFSLMWGLGLLIFKCCGYMGLSASRRYFAVKDGKEAKKAAWLAFFLMLGGTFIWIIPPMVARLRFADAVMSVGGSKPAETAFAIISMKLLPQGMVGLMVVAMFAATMSSMDTGLNTNAAVFINDIYPALCRVFRKKALEGRRLLFLAQAWTLVLGSIIIAIAINFSQLKGVGVFRLMQELGAVFGSVVGVPMLLGLFIRKTPPWSAMAAILIAAIPSAIGYMSGSKIFADIPLLAEPWKIYVRFFLNAGVGGSVFIASALFYKYSPKEYMRHLNAFFTCMKTPVDFEKEVGGAVDLSQLLIVGAFTGIIGLLICLLTFIPNSWGFGGRSGILFVGGTITGVGLLLFLAGRRSVAEMKRLQQQAIEKETEK
jgi:solute:Na+ symporter, SSS family